MKRLGAISVLFVFALFANTAYAAIGNQLNPGDQNTDVTALQTFLSSRPDIYPSGLVTGYYGSLTETAVQRYQCNAGIVCSGTPTTTGYGRVGPTTLASINASMGSGSPISLPSVGSPDVYAPIMSPEVLTVTPTSALVAWSTNEAATGRVMYGTSWPFLYATAPSASDPTFTTSHAVNIPNLQPNTTYYFTRESVDGNGNVMWTVPYTFRTSA